MVHLSSSSLLSIFVQDGLITLLPRVVDLVAGRDIPIIAAGGVIDARGYVAALALGAQGICLGTRFTKYSNFSTFGFTPNQSVLLKFMW